MGVQTSARYRPLRICVTGADATGKTSLAAELGRLTGAPVIRHATHEEQDDVSRAVERQARAEDTAPREAVLLILDTDVFTISVREGVRLGKRFAEIENLASYRQSSPKKVDFYLLTSPEPAAPGRSGGQAGAMHDAFEDALAATNRPFVRVGSGGGDRCSKALYEIRRFLLHHVYTHPAESTSPSIHL